jgi:hypothetical protein
MDKLDELIFTRLPARRIMEKAKRIYGLSDDIFQEEDASREKAIVGSHQAYPTRQAFIRRIKEEEFSQDIKFLPRKRKPRITVRSINGEIHWCYWPEEHIDEIC